MLWWTQMLTVKLAAKKSRLVLERVICSFNFDIASSRCTMLLVASIMHHDYGSDFQARGCCKNKAHKANDASSWWWNDCMMMWLHETSLIAIKIIDFPVFDESVTNGRTDRPTDGRTDRPSYRDARTHLKTCAYRRLKNSYSAQWKQEKGTC